VGNGLFRSALPDLCRSFSRRIAIVADPAIGATYGKFLEKTTGGTLFTFQGGERAKTRETKQELEDALLHQKFGRDTLLIGLGGGVVTDLSAFLAATYMRGVPLILVPTTLLGMVDAAIGGKNGVNTPAGKNLIGTTYHPLHICIDPELLSSLPEKEWIYGLAEILKYGLIANKEIWEILENNPSAWKESLAELILASVQTKKKVVEQDPFEKGLRRILNFGHTIAHAIEKLSDFQMPHGEAVAIGCIAESHLSWQLGHLKKEELVRIKTLFRKFPFLFQLPETYGVKALLDAMQMDKKAKEQNPRFALIDRIGHTLAFDGAYCSAIPQKELQRLLEEKLCLVI
jgi:3-dehydroquinate synthase